MSVRVEFYLLVGNFPVRLELIYASSAESQMSLTALHDILERARIVNSQLDVTGILLHAEGR
jgi:hypothetical protein